jgi:WhiB family redox-sensing transcriptional regulator
VFFPTNAVDVGKALAICATCPVRRQCREYALEAGEKFGVWGGQAARPRTAERARYNRLTRRTA